MPQKTPIGWTDYSSNPVRARLPGGEKVGWHCVKVSPGCAHCYSEAVDGRFGLGLGYTRAAGEKVEIVLAEKELASLLRLKGPARVFLGSMTDLFLDAIPDAMLDRIFAAVGMARHLTFQVLTKRPERARRYFARPGLHNDLELAADAIRPGKGHPGMGGKHVLPHLPFPNLWLGVSAEDQERADERIPILLSLPAAVRWVSAEPLLGPIDFHRNEYLCETWRRGVTIGAYLDWVVVGGESGPRRRTMELAWLESIAGQCQETSTACYVKQDSAARDSQQGRIPEDLWAVKELPTGRP